MRRTLLIPVLLLAALPTASAPKITGLWDAVVVVNQVEIPFRFEIAQTGAQVRGFFFDGDRKIGSTSGGFADGKLKLGYDFLNTTLDAATCLDGKPAPRHVSRQRDERAAPGNSRPPVSVPAQADAASTTPGHRKLGDVPHRQGQLHVGRFLARKLYLRQSGSEVSGAILRTSGDTGDADRPMEKAASWSLRPLRGRAARVVRGAAQSRRHAGRHSQPAVHLPRGANDRSARQGKFPRPPDPSRFTSIKDPTEPFHFSGLELDGKRLSDADAQFRGKVVVLTIGGTWCPNCHDEAPFLVDLYKEFHARGLEVVGLSV